MIGQKIQAVLYRYAYRLAAGKEPEVNPYDRKEHD